MVLTSKLLPRIFYIYYIKRSVLSGLFLFFTSHTFGIDESKSKISSIDIVGLSKTKPYIVKREIHHPIDSIIDSSIADLDRNRIFNLGLFDEVSWRLVPLEDGSNMLQFSLIESINKLPPIIRS